MNIRRHAVALLSTALLITTAACGEQASGSGENYPDGPVTITAPSEPGSGFDGAVRAVAEVMKKEGIVDAPMTVQNRPGGLSTTYLKAMVEQYEGDDDKLSVVSMSTVLLHLEERSKYGLDDVKMLSSLMSEYFMVVTAGSAPYDDLDAVFAELKKDPAAFPVAAQLEDSLVFILLAMEAGVDPSKIKFVTYEGGGEQATAVLNGDVKVAVAGISEFVGLVKSGDLKGLGVVSEEPVGDLDVPTSFQQGYKTTLANWRGLYGPPGMPGYAVEYWEGALKRMTESKSWAEVAKRNQWTTTFKTGDELKALIDETYQQVEQAKEGLGRPIIP